MHYLARKLPQWLYSRRLDRQLLKTYSRTRERPPQAEWITHPHNAEHFWETHGTHCWQKLARDLEQRDILPANQEGSDQENAHGKIQLHLHLTCTKGFQRKEQAMLWQSISRMFTTESIQAAEGPAHSLYSQPITAPHQLRIGLPQGSLFSPSLFNVYTPTSRQMWTKLNPASFSHWQMTGSYTKHQRTPRRQLTQCNNVWIVYPSSVTTPDLSSIHTRHKHCGAHFTTEQQANQWQCQQSHLMELWLNEQVIWDTLGSTLTECWPTVNMWKQQHWSARKVCCKGH